jgi:hexosaminidase
VDRTVSQDELHLLPAPRELHRDPGTLAIAGRAAVDAGGVGAQGAPAARALDRALDRAGIARVASGAPRIELALDAAGLPVEGYRLEISTERVRISAGEPRGLRHGVATFAQLLRERAPALPCLRIADAPDFARRGLMLDVSRDRVPTMASLETLVERMASWKLNVLQLYTEHTFAYPRHETVWRDASPLTPDEIRALDAFCAERGVELVPNQNSFGHMERWLRHPAYRELGELPEGGGCLAPGEPAARFVSSLYDALLPCFASRRVHAGCDETFDLGRGRSAAACAERGTARVYLDFLLRILADLHVRGRHVEFWGDIVLQHPELIAELPKDSLTADAWYYEAPRDPADVPAAVVETMGRYGYTRELLAGFAGHAPRFAEAGVPFQVCPGTSSWNTFVGRWSNSRENVRDAVTWGIRSGAEGVLVTDWGDNGHHQPPVVSLAPLAWTAALAWSFARNEARELETALALHVFPGARLAEAALALGDAHLATGLTSMNATPFFVSMRLPLRPAKVGILLRGGPDAAKLGAAAEQIDAIAQRLAGDDPDERDLRQAALLARHGTWRLLRGQLDAGPDRAALARDLDARIADQRERWLATSRPGGLRDSLAILERARADYGA